MALIKKKDVKNYFAARRRGQPFLVQPAVEPDATGSLDVEKRITKAKLVSAIEVPGPKYPVVGSPVPVITSAQNSGNELASDVKKSARG